MRPSVRLMFLQSARLLVLLTAAAVLARSSAGTPQTSVRKDQTYSHARGDQAEEDQSDDERLHAVSSCPIRAVLENGCSGRIGKKRCKLKASAMIAGRPRLLMV